MSKVDTQHPEYSDRLGDWTDMRNTLRGSAAVKAMQTSYLPMPGGFRAQPDQGVAMYDSYLFRAQFPELVTFTLNGMVGMVHKQEAKFDLPQSMMYLWERSTKKNLTLEALHRRITAELLLTGRYGLLADAEPGPGGLPYLAGYNAESIINWSDNGDFFVLDESGLERVEFEWVQIKKHRVLRANDGAYSQQVYLELEPSTTYTPLGRAGRGIADIPFVVIGARDLHVEPDEVPLLGVARSALAIYRLDADWRHQLFMSGQETLFINGVDDATKMPAAVGAGIVHGLPGEARAEYVGPACKGIEAHERAIAMERKHASESGARLFDKEPKQRVSGEALKTRYSAENATLGSVALASAAGLERGLRNIALMMGEDPNKVIVKPNLDFVDTTLNPQEALNLVSMWQNQGISWETLQENLTRGGIASEERSAEEERKLIKDNPPPKDEPEGGGAVPPKKDPIAKPPVKAI